MEKTEKTGFKEYIKERITHKAFIAIVCVYAAFCLGSGVYWACCGQIRNAAMSFAFTLFAALVFLAEYWLKIRCGELFTGAVLLLAAGSILGTCYNFYTIIPFFDTVLHGMAGVLFACLGFALAEKFFGKAEGKKSFFGCLVFAVCFSLTIAVVWEIFEYGCTVFLGFDMMEDAYVNSISSYLLAGSHSETVTLDGIVKTVIYYGNGQTYVLDGYLDLGLIDTLSDMLICTAGAIAFTLITVTSYFKCPKINEILIPRTLTTTSRRDRTE